MTSPIKIALKGKIPMRKRGKYEMHSLLRNKLVSLMKAAKIPKLTKGGHITQGMGDNEENPGGF